MNDKFETVFKRANDECVVACGYDAETFEPLESNTCWSVPKLKKVCKQESVNFADFIEWCRKNK